MVKKKKNVFSKTEKCFKESDIIIHFKVIFRPRPNKLQGDSHALLRENNIPG